MPRFNNGLAKSSLQLYMGEQLQSISYYGCNYLITTMLVYGAWTKLIMFYVQKYVTVLEMCHNQPLVRDKPLGAPASVKLVYCICSHR